MLGFDIQQQICLARLLDQTLCIDTIRRESIRQIATDGIRRFSQITQGCRRILCDPLRNRMQL